MKKKIKKKEKKTQPKKIKKRHKEKRKPVKNKKEKKKIIKQSKHKKITKKTLKSIRHKKENKKTREQEKIERVPTGIRGFDELIENGFKKNSTNVLVGGAGSGKSIFAIEFLLGGMKKGEKCLYVTFEEKKGEFYKNMKRFGWNLDMYEKKGLFIFLEYTPIKVKAMLEEGGGSIENLILSKKITRMVIDSITSFALLFDDELEKREASLSLFNMLSKWNCTSLLTLERKPGADGQISRTIEFESDSIIFLYFVRTKTQRERYLEILKMRGTKHSNKIYHFSIEKSGIKVEKRPASIKLDT